MNDQYCELSGEGEGDSHNSCHLSSDAHTEWLIQCAGQYC